jgi:hypothetical protein
VFRNNRNKQKTNRNSSKFVKISTFLIPHTISSVCFGCFDTGPKHQNKPKQTEKKNLGFRKESNRKTTKTYRVSVCFGSNREKKLTVSRTPLYRTFFGDFFGLFQENSVCFGCFDTSPKHRNKPKKMFFGFAKQTEKQPKQIEFRFVSV